MIKRVLAFGDSFVQGGGLNEDNSVHPASWPFKLGEKLNVPVTNKGVGGGSNKLAIINLMNEVNVDTIGANPSDNLVIFSWTGLQRTAFFDEEGNRWRNILIGHRPPFRIEAEIQQFYYSRIYSDVDGILNLWQQQIFLPLYLNSLGVKYFFVNSFTENYIINDRIQSKLNSSIFEMINKDIYMLGYTSSLFQHISEDLGMKCKDNYHPSIEGHDYISTLMIKYLEEKEIL